MKSWDTCHAHPPSSDAHAKTSDAHFFVLITQEKENALQKLDYRSNAFIVEAELDGILLLRPLASLNVN